MKRTEAIESILDEITNDHNTGKQLGIIRKVLTNLPDTALFSIYQDLFADRGLWDTCHCGMFEGTHRRDNRTGLCSRADLDGVQR